MTSFIPGKLYQIYGDLLSGIFRVHKSPELFVHPWNSKNETISIKVEPFSFVMYIRPENETWHVVLYKGKTYSINYKMLKAMYGAI